jgi:hypothetical protein
MAVKRARPEDEIQRAVIAHFAVRGVRDAFVFAVPNGGVRSPIEAAIMRGLGTRAGTPDLFMISRGEVFALELKSESGRATAVQLQAIKDIRRAGGHAEICCGIDRTVAVLEGWGLLCGQASISR